MTRPSPATTFVGRASELERLDDLLESRRLATLLGPGGMGKTRLALKFVETRGERFEAGGGVFFVDLTEARTASAAFDVMATSLGVQLEGTPEEAIGRALDRLGPVLVVLDNFESVAHEAANAVGVWTQRAPAARLLVTSRVALEVEGEQLLPLEPLSREEAIELFVGRARLVQPDLDVDDETVSAIVDAIDRMPLAIELAASRTRVLSPGDIRRRLERRLELLRTRDPDERHGSVRRAVLDSVELLPAPARRAFTLASALRNGFRLDDAEAVLGSLLESSVLDAFDELARTSLLRVHLQGAETRYGYFETLRDVAAELAADEPFYDQARALQARHFAERCRSGAAQPRLERDNLLQAHATSVELARENANYARDAVAIAITLETVLPATARVRCFEGALTALGSSNERDRLCAHLGRGRGHRDLGQTELATRDFEAALALAQTTQQSALAGVALTQLGGLLDVQGDTGGARRRVQEALPLLEDPAHEAEARLLLGHTHRREGALDEARAEIEHAIAIYGELCDDAGLAAALYERAVIEIFLRTSGASATLDAGLEVARRGNDAVMEGVFLTARGTWLQESRSLDEALECHAQAARIFAEHGRRYREGSVLYYLATTYLERGEPEEALAVLQRARACVAAVGSARYETLMAAVAAVARARLGQEEAAAELEDAQAAAIRVVNEPSLQAALAVHRLTVGALGAESSETEASAAIPEAERLVNAHPNDDTRLALRLLEAAAKPEVEARSLRVWEGGLAFAGPGSDERVELPDGSPLRPILDLLATRRIDAPGEAVSIDDVIRAGWPGEKIRVDAALNRAYVAISTLRKKGLRDFLVRTGGGYALSQAVVVRRVSP